MNVLIVDDDALAVQGISSAIWTEKLGSNIFSVHIEYKKQKKF